MKKKQILFVVLFAIAMLGFHSVGASAVENSSYKESTTDFGKSLTEYEYFDEIKSLEPELMRDLSELYLVDYPTEDGKLPEDFPAIRFEDAIKVYVETNIQNLDTAEEGAIKELLSASNYVWVLPIKYKNVNMQITLAKGNPLNEDTAVLLTEEERNMIENRSGKWVVTETAIVGCDNYKEQIANLGEPYDYVVFVGGIPGIQYPLALGFKDGAADSFIGIGYSLGVLEEAVTVFESGKNPICNYNDAIQKIQSYKEPVGTFVGGGSKGKMVDKPFVFFIVGGIVFFGVIVYLTSQKDFVGNKKNF